MTAPTRNARIRALRQARGWTQQQAADAVAAAVEDATGHGHQPGIDAHWISRLERGDVRWPNATYRAALRAVYNTDTDAELGLFGARQRPTETTPSQRRSADAPMALDLTPQSWQLMDALTRSNISPETVDQIRRAVFASAARYPSTPPRQLLPQVLSQLERLQSAMLSSQSLRVLRQCVELTGMLAGLAGNLYLDIGDPFEARNYFEIGQAAGSEAEEDGLTAWVLTMRSIGPYFSGHFDEAIGLLEQASRLVERTGNHRRAAWVNAMAARAYAARGHRSQTLTALEASASQLTEADAPAGVDFFDQGRFEGIAGSCHLRLRDPDASEPMLRAALDRRAETDTKGRALLVLDLAECRIIQGEIEDASELATTALDLASSAIVHPIATRAKLLQNELSPWQGLGAVAEYADRVHELSATVPDQRG